MVHVRWGVLLGSSTTWGVTLGAVFTHQLSVIMDMVNNLGNCNLTRQIHDFTITIQTRRLINR